MKWYFASRTRHIHTVTEISKFLESKGETVVSSWIYESLSPPFEADLEKAHEFTKKITDELFSSDVLVLISDPGGTDMFIELGISLGKNHREPGSTRIYIIGEHSKRSLLQLHPSIVHAKTMQDVLTQEHLDYTLPTSLSL